MKLYYAAILFSLFTFTAADAGIILNSPASYTQNFDSLALTGTSSVTPSGWLFAESETNANATYTAGTGSSTTGDTYSFGSSGSSDRAFGGLRSGTLIPTIGASFTNGGATAIQSLLISYDGEQWRLGTTGRTDRLDFQYSLNATALNNGTWLDHNALDFSTPSTTTFGMSDGNLASNRTLLSSSLNGFNLTSGQTLWIRWNDFDASGSDDGLAIDNFSITASFAAVPEPSSIVAISTAALCALLHRKHRKHQPTA